MLEIWFDKPPVRFTQDGVPYTLAEDFFHSRAGQEIILKMAAMGLGQVRLKTNDEQLD